jgi:syntaxin-binding protein 1
MKNALGDEVEWSVNRGVLLVADRSVDPVAPLMHDFFFQGFLREHLDYKGDVITTPGILTDKDPQTGIMKSLPVVINEYDGNWQKYRHMHIADAMEQIPQEMQKFIDAHPEVARMKGLKVSGDAVCDNQE